MRGKPTKKIGKPRKAIVPERDDGIKLEKDIDGLLPNWILFIDEYFANGFNGRKAYMKVYKTENERNADASASRLLSYVSVNAEIQYRLTYQKITKQAISGELWDVSQKNKILNPSASVSALGVLAKASGMLVDDINLKGEFNANNPALILPVISKEKFDEINERIAKGERITE